MCDLRNYERLLRSLSAHRSESFEPVPIERIALHTAQLQGLTNGTHGHEGLSDILERTSDYPAPAELWESDILPARLKPYDPSSMCGLKCSDLKLSARRRTTHLVYSGANLAIVSQRSGRHLNIFIPPGDPQMEDCLARFNHLPHRPIKPLKRIIIKSINNKPATESAYVEAFETAFKAHDEGTEFVLYRS